MKEKSPVTLRAIEHVLDSMKDGPTKDVVKAGFRASIYVNSPFEQAEGMQKCMSQIRTMMRAFGQETPDYPRFPDQHTVDLRIRLVEEEVVQELIPAIHARDMVKVADGIGDSIVVLLGMAVAFGLPMDRIWEAINDANMSKVGAKTGKVRRDIGGKVLKPDDFVPPDERIQALLVEYAYKNPEEEKKLTRA